MKSLKELAIIEYLAKIDFKRDKWSYHLIEEDMKRFLGERPSLEPVYEKDVMLNEVSGEAKEFKSLKYMNIIFTDTDNRIKKLQIKI